MYYFYVKKDQNWSIKLQYITKKISYFWMSKNVIRMQFFKSKITFIYYLFFQSCCVFRTKININSFLWCFFLFKQTKRVKSVWMERPNNMRTLSWVSLSALQVNLPWPWVNKQKETWADKTQENTGGGFHCVTDTETYWRTDYDSSL